MNAAVEKLNLAEMSDEEINNLEPSMLEGNEENPPPGSGQGEDQSAISSEEEDNASDETDGADSEDESSDEETEGADDTSAEETEETGTETQTDEEEEQTSAEDQTADSSSESEAVTDDSTGDTDFKAEYSKLMAPFKAAKRTITPENPEDARRLMQMGVDYARKMEEMKPYRRVLKTLEKADLIDVDTVNFLIDLHKKDPAAIKKFLKDSEIDPIDLDLEDDSNYKPTDHMVGDKELAMDDVLDEIRGTPSFSKTVEVVTKQWDSASQKLLMDNPEVLRHINAHIEEGIYEQILDRVTTERTFGRLNGLSDLEAYKAVGDAMLEKGEFGSPTSGETSAAGDTSQGDSGHPNGSEASVNARKRAASPTKGSASTGKKKVDFSKMSDEQIEKFDISTL